MRIALILAAAPLLLHAAERTDNSVTRRLDEAAVTFSEIMAAPDKGIPRDLLNRAHCAVIVPGLKKGAFVFGAEYGKGFVTCRGKRDHYWSAPAAIRVEGGSFGFQIGGSETDVIMLVMNDRGAQRMLESQFTLGGEGEVAAGPVGRETTAQTDAKFTAEISPGRAREASSRGFLCRVRRCARTSTITPRFMASGWKIVRSSRARSDRRAQDASSSERWIGRLLARSPSRARSAPEITSSAANRNAGRTNSVNQPARTRVSFAC